MAGLEICNETGVKQSVSVGYKQGDDWVSEGWWNIAPGACAEPVGGALTNRYYYYRAEAAGRAHVAGEYGFCTQSAAYTIMGDGDCEARGYKRAPFAVIDTGETAKSFTLTLTARPGGAKQDAAKTQAAPPAPEPEVEAAPARATRMTSGLARGAHGEPYSGRLLFQGCDFYDGFEACSFIGEGWKFYAGYDAPTPRAFLARLEGLALNTPMAVTGDLISHGDSSAQLAIGEIEVLAGQDPYAGLRAAMQGNWVSADDPTDTLYIHGAEMHSYYQGSYVDSYLLDVKAQCPEGPPAGPVMVQTSLQHRDNFCYVIDTLAGGWMDLTLIGQVVMQSYRKTD